MPDAAAPAVHDVFISYSRVDTAFAAALEKALKRYRPPKDLDVPQRRLDVFRDEEDFTGTEYYSAVDRHLQGARKLVLVCSPHAARSEFVNDEVRRFVRAHAPKDVIPLLVAGTPNNEAPPGDASTAFPPALSEALALPLAADYRGFDARRDRVDGGRHRTAWYKLLADLYERSRAEVEAREQRRRVRQRVQWGSASVVIALAIGSALLIASRQRSRANTEERIARSNALAGSAMAAVDRDAELGGLLAIAAAEQQATVAAASALRVALARLPDAQLTVRPAESMDAVVPVAFTPDAKRVAVADRDTVRIVDVATGRVLSSVPAGAPIGALRYSPDGALLAVVSGAGKSAIHVAESGVRVAAVDGELHWTRLTTGVGSSAVVLRDHDVRLVDVGVDGGVRVVREMTPPGYALDQYAPYTSLLSPDGERIATLDENSGRLSVTDLRSGATVSRVVSSPEGLGGVTWSARGTNLAAFGLFGFAVVDPRTLQSRFTRDAGREIIVEDASFGADEHQFATTDRNGTTTVWDVRARRQVAALTATEDRVYQPVFSTDGALVSVRTSNGRADVWNLENGRKLATLDAMWGEVWRLDMAPDGETLAAQYERGRVAVWQLQRWRRERRLSPRDAAASSVRHRRTLGNRALRIEGHDAALVDTTNGRRVLRFPHGDDVRSAEFSPGGYCAVTASGYRMASGSAPEDGNVVRVWDAATATLLVEWRLGVFGADSAYFRDDSHVVVFADGAADGYRTELCAPMEDLVRLVRARVGRTLTPAERATYLSR